MFQKLVYGTMRYDRDTYLQRFVTHNMEVMRYFQHRPGDLLVIDICSGEGWELLCPFIGALQPKVPFPRCRSVAEAKDYVKQHKCAS